ncbi:MAG: flagellar basal body L-ring protein FlgH [Balneolaceae bacterium]|nr:flagellar basal body L-ring protein FlgH [Balneolaceae bacterium]MCH8547291.1 flagellar basal body L-ring protein FlgH [Balneolaceae bacterium]
MAKNIMKTGLFGVMLMLFATQVDAQHSLYRDIKANQIGDIITVVLVENISGSSSSDNRRASSSNGSASGGVSSNFIPFEPTFGSDVSVDYGSDDRNAASQRQLLQGNMSVQIVDVTDQGDLIVEGTRSMKINGETHKMNLTGTIRARDVDSRNQVLSYRVANANISYEKQGGIKDATKRRGLFRRVVFTGVAAALGAAILQRELR